MKITTTDQKKNKKKKVMMEKKLSSQIATSSSLKKKKKHMLVYVAVCYTELNDDEPDKNLVRYDWYAFDPRKSPVQQFELLQPVTRMMTPFRHGRAAPPVISSISIDSKVYVFKTYVVETSSSPPYPITYISMFDTVTKDWADISTPKKLKIMLPQLIACGGKIFILGRNDARKDRTTIWGEMFDPNTNSLTPLPAPPAPALLVDQYLRLDSSVLIDDHRFLVKFKYQLQVSIFDVTSWTWSSIAIPDVSCDDRLKMIASNGVLHFFCANKIYICDLPHVGYEAVEVGGFVFPPCAGRVYNPFFPVHTGGNSFYLIWTPDEHYRGNGGSVIHCLKFRIDRVIDYSGEQVWQATIDGCDSYVVNGGYVQTCVPVEGNRKWMLERCGVENLK